MKYLFLFLLVACADSTLLPKDMEKAIMACVKNDGVKEVDVWKGVMEIYCKDGAMFKVARY